MTGELAAREIGLFFLVFGRLGGAIMVMPGFSGSYVPMRTRLIVTFAITLVTYPAVRHTLPPVPQDAIAYAVVVGGELGIGFFFGAISATMMAALNFGGRAASFAIGQANAMVQDPTTNSQAALFATFLTNFALLMIFVLDLHHIFFRAVINSYNLFPPGQLPPMGDLTRAMARYGADAVEMGLQLVSPFFFLHFVQLSLVGVLTRLIPNVPMFFVMVPLRSIGGMVVLLITFEGILMWFAGYFEEGLIRFTGL